MNEMDCGEVREILPDFAAKRIETQGTVSVEAHLSSCEDCRSELGLIQMLQAASPVVPVLLADRVASAVRTSKRSAHRPWSGIAAAAVVLLALGVGMSRDRADVMGGIVFESDLETEQSELWLSEDGVLAGALWIEGLSDETLMKLLAELESEGVV